MSAEEPLAAPGEPEGGDVADECDEIAARGEKPAPWSAREWRWIILAAWLVAIVADHLEVDHAADVIAALAAALGINRAAHLGAFIEGRLFIHESDEADGVAAGCAGE